MVDGAQVYMQKSNLCHGVQRTGTVMKSISSDAEQGVMMILLLITTITKLSGKQ